MRIWPRNDDSGTASISQSNPAMRVDTIGTTERSTLDILRDLTARLPPVPFERLSRDLNGRRVELLLERGGCVMTGLYAEPDMSAAMAEVQGGSRMAPHTHDQIEFFIVLTGQMIAHLGGETFSTGAGECYAIPAGTVHWVEWPTDTKVLVATIPQSPGFPHARE